MIQISSSCFGIITLYGYTLIWMLWNFATLSLYLTFRRARLGCSYPRADSRRPEDRSWACGNCCVQGVLTGVLRDVPVEQACEREISRRDNIGARIRRWLRYHLAAGRAQKSSAVAVYCRHQVAFSAFRLAALPGLLQYNNTRSWHPPCFLKFEVAIVADFQFSGSCFSTGCIA